MAVSNPLKGVTTGQVTSALSKTYTAYDIGSKIKDVVDAPADERLKTVAVKAAEIGNGYVAELAATAAKSVATRLFATAGAEALVAGSATAAVATGGTSLVAEAGFFAVTYLVSTAVSYIGHKAIDYVASRATR